jgi:ribulose-phosphate 3-epimerase
MYYCEFITMNQISVSILSADFSRLGEEIEAINQTDADYIHIDIMDGHFVPNISFGQPVLKHISCASNKSLDTHLMITNPEKYIDDFIALGSQILTFHLEAVQYSDKLISYIKSCGIKAGIAINPSTHPINLEYLIEKLDLILIMTVNPGFGGQVFIPNQLKKIEFIKALAKDINPNLIISVDGGVTNKNAKQLIDAGADMLVAGSYIFSDAKDSNEYQTRIDKLRY